MNPELIFYSLMERLLYLALAFTACMLFFSGCNILGKQSCVPGETSACLCGDGNPGVQICSGHGTSFSACSCTGSGGDVLEADGEAPTVKPCINANECDDQNPCTTGLCGADGFCVFAFNTVACDDGDECSVGDRCFLGLCEPGKQELECEDGNLCTDDECVSWQGCVSKNNTEPCDDGDSCTLGDACLDGVCEPGGELMTCDAAPQSDCVGDIAHTYGSPGECTSDGCDYPVVAKDCTASKMICVEGLCVEDPGPSLTLNGSLTVSSAADIETANLYSEVSGDLIITGSVPAETVFPFLKKIGGRLWVHQADDLAELALPKLSSVGADLAVEDLTSLERLSFPLLDTVGSEVRLEKLPECYQINAGGLKTLGTHLVVRAVDGIKNLILKGLEHIPGDVLIHEMGGLKILNLSMLETVGGSVSVKENSELTTLHLDVLQVVGGAFHVSSSSKVLGLDLGALETVGSASLTPDSGSFELSGLTALNDLNSPLLEAIRGSLKLSDLAFIEELAFDSLTKVAGVHISGNAALLALSFPVLATVDPCWIGGEDCEPESPGTELGFILRECPSLTNCNLPVLTVVEGAVEVEQNTMLQSLKMDDVESVFALHVEENPNLMVLSFDALSNVSAAEGNDTSLRIIDNLKLETVSLDSLQTVEGAITFSGNALPGTVALVNLESASAIEFAENQSTALLLSKLGLVPNPPTLAIESNPLLEDIVVPEGFGNVCWNEAFPNPAGVWGSIVGNPSLPQCAALLKLGCGTPGPCGGQASAPCPYLISGNREDCSCVASPSLMVFCSGSEKCGGALACDDQNPCTQDLCSETAQCLSVPIEGICDDGDPCFVNDACFEGVCLPGPTPLVCDDGNVCTDDSCTEGIGCTASPNASDCDDGSVCTLDETCFAGTCAPGVDNLECDDGNSCTDDACDAIGGCVHEVNLNLLACDDGDICTLNDQCVQGICMPGNTPNPCDDGSDCTLDQCQPEFGCLHGPIQGPCDDGDPCTIGDYCEAGTCKTGPETLDCSVAPGAHCNGDMLYEYLQAGLCAADICLFVPTITDCSLEQMVCENAKCILAPDGN